MRIVVAVSGGTDSLFALLLLRKQGLEPVAVHADFLKKGREASAEIERLLAELDIPFHWIDLSDPFQRLVIDPFIAGYVQGLTPNPCAHCNRLIKFGLLHDWAMKNGFSAMATGHYARVLEHGSGPALCRGIDTTKDQSYFLSLVPREKLLTVRLPLGEWRKQEVQETLSRWGVTPPLPRESQEICFIPGNDYRQFLLAHGPELPVSGQVEDLRGAILGRHLGLWRHTLGQRRGLGIASSQPLYVLDKDFERNVLVVGTREELMTSTCTAHSTNFLQDPSAWPDRLLVQTVYRQKAKPAQVQVSGQSMRINFEEPRPRACPGQVAAVFSMEGQVLAGGIISSEGSAA
jgi:tRNA-uridine 2-sulfurtransferase